MVKILKNTVCFFVIIIIALIFFSYLFYTSNYQPPEDDDLNANGAEKPDDSKVLNYTYKVRNTYPHDPNAFTQGLVIDDGLFYEGTGLYGSSSLRKIEPQSGEVLKIHNLSSQYFGEGITIYDDRIIQLTWKSQIGFIYDKETFNLIGTFNYSTEGWGITHDNKNLIMSDGTDSLYFLDPTTFTVVKKIHVRSDFVPVDMLNELEFISGEIFANVWQTDQIVKIDPETGNVTGWIDLAGLLSPEDKTENVNVLNGIAYDPQNGKIFVTGKNWPKLFEIELLLIED